jgi:hypothetical protein
MNELLLLVILATAPQAGDPPACESVARAARIAATHGAHADFWLSVAGVANLQSGRRAAALAELRAERDEALALAEAQFQARQRACSVLGHGAYRPELGPEEFSADVTSGLSPLVPGKTFVYERRGVAGLERIETTVALAAVEIGGFACRPVETVETLDGVPVERTTDWYSQRKDGSVWYFGEYELEFADGLPFGSEGSWRAGMDGAWPGVLMPAAPAAGVSFRMEFLIGCAEDIGRVVGTDESVSVPAGDFDHCVAVEEWSPLEPADVVVKYYAPQVGMVLEVDRTTGERLELLELR